MFAILKIMITFVVIVIDSGRIEDINHEIRVVIHKVLPDYVTTLFLCLSRYVLLGYKKSKRIAVVELARWGDVQRAMVTLDRINIGAIMKTSVLWL